MTRTKRKASWKRTTLRPLLADYIGGGWGSEARDDVFSEPGAVIRGTDIPNAVLGVVGEIPRRFHKRSNMRARELAAGNIVFEVSGGSKDQPLGRALFCSTSLLRKINAPVMPASFCKRLVVNQSECEPRFLYYFLLQIYKDRRVAQWQVQSTGISNFQFEAFLDECELLLPPLEEQSRVVAILSAYDELIENNTRRIAILEEMARRIYEDWFVHFRFPGHENARMVESELGPIPEGWAVKALGVVAGEVIDYRGKTPSKLGGKWASSGIPALSALNIKSGKLVNLEKAKWVDEELYKRWMKVPLRRGDILMTSEAPLGELYLLSTTERYVLSQRLFGIRADEEIITPTILFLTLRSSQVQAELVSRATGATVSGIRQAELRKVPILVPVKSVQSKIEPVLSSLTALVAKLSQANANLRTMRDLLLPKLISGELDVSAMPEPEAAVA